MTKLIKPNNNMGKGFFGIGVENPKTEHNLGTLVRSAKQFGASFVFTIGHRYKKEPSAVKLDNKNEILILGFISNAKRLGLKPDWEDIKKRYNLSAKDLTKLKNKSKNL